MIRSDIWLKLIASGVTLSTLGYMPARLSAAPDPAIREYVANYRIQYKGRYVGSSEFTVRYDAAEDVYRFSSVSRFRGFLRFLSPRPIVERSVFAAEAGRLIPLDFAFEDGSRSGKGNFSVRFAWDDGVAVVDNRAGSTEYTITEGVLDRGAMQVQVMVDMAKPAPLGSFVLVDEDGLRTYAYRSDGDTTLETPFGEFATHAHVQERTGSSRQTFLWAAPALDYLPVRIEQRRDGELRTAFVLETVEWGTDQ